MYRSNTQKPAAADVADLIVPGTSSIVRILVSSEGNHLSSVTVWHSTGTGARVDRDRDFFLREFMEGSDE